MQYNCAMYVRYIKLIGFIRILTSEELMVHGAGDGSNVSSYLMEVVFFYS